MVDNNEPAVENNEVHSETSEKTKVNSGEEMIDIRPAANRILTTVAGALPKSSYRPGYHPCRRVDTMDFVSHRTAKARAMVSEQSRITTNLSSAGLGLYLAEKEVEQMQRDLEKMRSRNRYTVCRTPADYVYKYQRNYSLKDFI